MNTFDRRKFLKSVLCGAALMIAGGRPLSLLANQPAKNNPVESPDNILLKQFDQARMLFHKKQFAESELLYKSMLAGLPAHISIYDCYKNLLSRQNRTDEAISHFKQAIAKYPCRADFYDRLAKTYREIATGNKKIEKRVCQAENQTDLMQVALECYGRAIEYNPDKKFLYFGMLDTLCAVDRMKENSIRKGRSAAGTSDIPQMSERERRLTGPYLQEWLDRKKPLSEKSPKGRMVDTVPVRTRMQIEKITAKVRRPMYDPIELACRARDIKVAIKRLNSELHDFYAEEKLFGEMTMLTLTMLRDDPNETQVLGKARKQLVRAKMPDLELQLYTGRAGLPGDFWTQSGMAKAYLHQGNLTKARELIDKLTANAGLRVGKKVDLIRRGLCDCAIAEGQFTQGREHILKGIETVSGLGGVATALLFKYAECLCLENKYREAIELLRKRLDPGYVTDVSDPVLKFVAPDMGSSTELYYLHQFYNKDKKMHAEEKASVLCAIAKVQQKQGDKAGVVQTCREIEMLIPSHPFVKKINTGI